MAGVIKYRCPISPLLQLRFSVSRGNARWGPPTIPEGYSRKSLFKIYLVKRQCLLIFLLLKPGHRTFRSPDLEIKSDRYINSAPFVPLRFFPRFFKESKRERMGMGRSLSACAPGWLGWIIWRVRSQPRNPNGHPFLSLEEEGPRGHSFPPPLQVRVIPQVPRLKTPQFVSISHGGGGGGGRGAMRDSSSSPPYRIKLLLRKAALFPSSTNLLFSTLPWSHEFAACVIWSVLPPKRLDFPESGKIPPNASA